MMDTRSTPAGRKCDVKTSSSTKINLNSEISNSDGLEFDQHSVVANFPPFLNEFLGNEKGGIDVDLDDLDIPHLSPKQAEEIYYYCMKCTSANVTLPNDANCYLVLMSLAISRTVLDEYSDLSLNMSSSFSVWKTSTDSANNAPFIKEVWPQTLKILHAAASVQLLRVLSSRWQGEISQTNPSSGTVAVELSGEHEYLSSVNNHRNILSRNFSEECIERSITILHKFLSCNYSLYSQARHMTQLSKSKKSDDDSCREDFVTDGISSSTRNGSDVGRDGYEIPKRVQLEIARQIYEITKTHLSCLTHTYFHCPHKHHDRLCIVTYEYCFTILRSNFFGQPGYISGEICSHVLVELGIMLLSHIFTKYPSCRSNILEELFPFLSQCYTHPKNHPRVLTVPLSAYVAGLLPTHHTSCNSLFEAAMTFHATTGLALVVTLFQNLVSLKRSSTLCLDTINMSGTCNSTYMNFHQEVMREFYSTLSSFLKGFLKRCANKETSGSYREALNGLILELVTAAPAPAPATKMSGCPILSVYCPIAPLLLKHTISSIISELKPHLPSPNASSSSNTSKQSSYLMFLVDLIGGIGCKLRQIILDKDQEDKMAAAMVKRGLSSDAVHAITRQLRILRVEWNKEIQKQQDQQKKSRKKCVTKNFSSNPSKKSMPSPEDYSLGKDNACHTSGMNVGNTLEANLELGSTVLDSLVEDGLTAGDPQSCQATPSAVENCKGLNKEVSPTFVAFSLPFLLREVGWKDEEIADFFPHSDKLTLLDVRQAFVLRRLKDLLRESSLAKIQDNCSLTLQHVIIGGCDEAALRQSLFIHCALWLRDAIERANYLLGQYILDEINDLCQATKANDSHSTNESRIISNSLAPQTCDKKLFCAPSPEKASLRFDGSICGSHGWSAICYRQVSVERHFTQDSETMLHLLMLLTSSHPSPQVRARCMKSLGLLVVVDVSLLRLPRMEELVVERFNDVSISVREETVKLVGKYLLTLGRLRSENESDVEMVLPTKQNDTYASADTYLDGLLTRLRDKGVSVRKSVAYTLREILLHQPDHPRYSELCRRLLERCWLPKEETTLKEAIQATFEQVWFSPPPLSAIQGAGVSSSNEMKLRSKGVKAESGEILRSTSCDLSSEHLDMPTLCRSHSTPAVSLTPSAKAEDNDTMVNSSGSGRKNHSGMAHAQKYIGTTAAQIVDVIASTCHDDNGGGSSEQAWLVKMLQGMLHSGKDSTKTSSSDGTATYSDRQLKARQNLARLHCQQLVDCLIELLLQTEDDLHRNDKNASPFFKELSGADCVSNSGDADRIVAIFVTLLAFCEAYPPYVIRHLHTLLPYLKGDSRLSSKQEGLVCLKLVQMLSLGFLCDLSPKSVSITSSSDQTPVTTSTSFNLGLNIQCAAWVSQAEEISQDLTRISLKYGNAAVIEASICCLARLCQYVTQDPKPIHSLAQKCFKTITTIGSEIHMQQIRTWRESTTPSMLSVSSQQRVGHVPGVNGRYTCATQAQLARLQRCIVVLGYICEQTSLCSVLNVYPDTCDTAVDESFPFTSHEEDLRIAQCPIIDVTLSDHTGCWVCPYSPAQNKANLCGVGDVTAELPLWSINGACFACVYFLLHIESEVLHSRAVQAMCSTFIGSPKLIMFADSMGLIAHLFQERKETNAAQYDGYSDIVHDKLLQGLQHVMVMEEKRLNQNAVLDQMRQSGSNVVLASHVKSEAEHSADASITGSILQHHLQPLLGFLSHHHPRIRRICLDLLGVLLSHGMIHPMDVIAYLIGLQGDPDESIRKTALHLLQVEDEKHSSFFDNRLLDGMEMAFTLQCLLKPDLSPVAYFTVSDDAEDENLPRTSCICISIFAPLYQTCIRPSKKRRSDFIAGILRRCDNAVRNISTLYNDHVELVLSSGSKSTCARGGTPGKSDFDSACNHLPSSYCFLNSEIQQVEAAREANSRLKRTSEALASSEESKLGSSPLTFEMTQNKANHVAKGGKKNPHISDGLLNATRRGLFCGPLQNTKTDSDHQPRDETALEECLLCTTKNHFNTIKFLLSTIATIPYETCDEPLHIIYWINRHSAIRLGIRNTQFRTALKVLGCVDVNGTSCSKDVAVCDEDEEISLMLPPFANAGEIEKPGSKAKLRDLPTSECDLQQQGKHFMEEIFLPNLKSWLLSHIPCDFSSRKQNVNSEKNVLRNPECVNEQISRIKTFLISVTLESISGEMLLRLKEYMKATYGLTDDRCASFTPSSSVKCVGSNGSNSNGSGRFVGEAGVPVGLKFEPLAPRIGTSLMTLLSGNDSTVLSCPLWKVVHLATGDHNRMLLLLTEGGCDFNTNSSALRARSTPRKRRRGAINKKCTKPVKRKKRKSTFHSDRSLTSIVEGDEHSYDSEYSDSNDGDQTPNRTPTPSKKDSTTPSSSGARSSSRKRKKTTKLGEFLESDSAIVDDIEEEVKRDESSGREWQIDFSKL